MHRHICDLPHGLDRKKALMAGDEDVGESHQAFKYIVVDDVGRPILKEKLAFLFIDINGQRA